MKNQKNNIFAEISYKKVAIIFACLFVILFIIFFKLPGSDKKESVSKTDYLSATIVKITDGDTIWIEYDDTKKKVRLIGIDCPEYDYYDTDTNNLGKLSTEFTKSKLAKGQTVYLMQDSSDEDTYGRLLRYVWLEVPDNFNDEAEIRSKMLNAIILLNGYANAKEYAPDIQYTKLFSNFESEARDNQLGLWKPVEE